MVPRSRRTPPRSRAVRRREGRLVTIKITVLGCSGSYAGPGGACSGYLVQGGGVNLWLDAGPGTLANLQEHLELDALNGIVISHSHPDHWVDLLPFHNVVKYIRKRSG